MHGSPDSHPPHKSSAITEEEIEHAINLGAAHYFDDCRARIPAFVQEHFRYPGTLKTNRVAWGWDILRAPLNLFWAPIYTLVSLCRFIVRKFLGIHPFYRLLQRVPTGFNTRVHHHIAGLIMTDLLNNSPSDTTTNTKPFSLIEDHIVTSLQALYKAHGLPPISTQKFHHWIEPLVADALNQYQVTRTASADITNSLSCTILGAFAFHKFTPGGIGIGVILATMLNKTMASHDFLLGSAIGEIYYGMLPPAPSTETIVGMTLLVMVILAIFSALSGVIIDPIQARLGLHQYRLRKLINTLERDFQQKTQGSFRPKDQFVARIMDTFDMIRTALS